MIFSDQDKKLVDQYKQANILLRKKLENLNTQIDRLLEKHSNKVGLQKLPEVSKKITDPKVIQQEVQNLRKRLELLERDNQLLQNRSKNNYHALIKQSEAQLQEQDVQSHELQRIIREYQRKDKIADVIASKQQKGKKWEKRVSHLQQELARAQKIQKQLIKEMNVQAVTQAKSTDYLRQVSNKHHEVIVKIQEKSRNKNKKHSPQPQKKDIEIKKGGPSEEQWKKLKIDFLTFKESKQNQENALNEENQNLRQEIREWMRKIKEKRNRIEVIKSNEQKEKIRAKNYATLEQSNVKKRNESYRYRDKNNSVRYNNTKNY